MLSSFAKRKNLTSPIERRKKLLGWQTSRSTDRKIKYLLMFICAIVVFTIGNYGEDDSNGNASGLEQSGSIEPSVHLLSQG